MTFRVILCKDVIYKNNTSPLCLLFFHDNRKKSVGLGVSVAREYWDAEAQKVTDDCPDRDDIQFQITAKIKAYEKKIKKLEALEIPVTFEMRSDSVVRRWFIRPAGGCSGTTGCVSGGGMKRGCPTIRQTASHARRPAIWPAGLSALQSPFAAEWCRGSALRSSAAKPCSFHAGNTLFPRSPEPKVRPEDGCSAK